MSELNIHISSDYACAGPFYYGYERLYCPKKNVFFQEGEMDSDDAEWCFMYTNPLGSDIFIPSSKLGADKFDVTHSLIAGMCQINARLIAALNKATNRE